jgi:hypothetical protein
MPAATAIWTRNWSGAARTSRIGRISWSPRHPSATALHGRKRQYIAPVVDDMYNPAPILGTDLFVESNISSKNMLSLVDKLLQAFGYNTLDVFRVMEHESA